MADKEYLTGIEQDVQIEERTKHNGELFSVVSFNEQTKTIVEICIKAAQDMTKRSI